jgi:hypothetical protein
MPDRRQADKLNAGRELIGDCGGYGEGEACFAGTARASESQKPNVAPEQQGRGFRELLLSSNKGSTWNWQIVAPVGDFRRGQVTGIG